MSAEWVTAIATSVTALVIAASAIAALMQLRHMRSGNAISLLTSYNNEFDTVEFQAAFAYVVGSLTEHLREDAGLDGLAKAPPFLGDLRHVRTIANFFEDMGAFVLTGLLDKHIVCLLYSDNVKRAWEAIGPVATVVRTKMGNAAIWENFEYLAAISDEFMSQHPTSFPAGVARKPSDTSVLERLRSRGDLVDVR
jgi:hypothetical protein